MIDVGALLEKVEAAAPIDAVEAVAAALGEMVDAHEVDLPDRRLQRPGRRPADLRRLGSTGARSHGVEQAETLPLEGTRLRARAAHAAARSSSGSATAPG